MRAPIMYLTPEEQKRLERELRPLGIIHRNPWPRPGTSAYQPPEDALGGLQPAAASTPPTPTAIRVQAATARIAIRRAVRTRQALNVKTCALCHHAWHKMTCKECGCPDKPRGRRKR